MSYNYLDKVLRGAIREAESRALAGDEGGLAVLITGSRRILYALEKVADRHMMGPARREKITGDQSKWASQELAAIRDRTAEVLRRNEEDE